MIKNSNHQPEESILHIDFLKYLRKVEGMPFKEINKKACEIAANLSKEWNTLVAGSISQSEAYMYEETRNEKAVKAELRVGMEYLINENVDFLLVEVSMVLTKS